MFLSGSITRIAALTLTLCLVACIGHGAQRDHDEADAPTASKQRPDSGDNGEQENKADKADKAPAAPRVSHVVFRSAIETLTIDESSPPGRAEAEAPTPDPSLLLTEEQRALAQEVYEAVQEEFDAYTRRHRAELRELMPLLTLRGEIETEDGRERRDHARERIAEIREETPEPHAHHDRLWRALTEAQRAHVLEQLADRRTALPPREMMRRGARRVPAPAPPAPAPATPEEDKSDANKSVEERVFDGGPAIERAERMERIRRRSIEARLRLERMQAEKAKAEAERREREQSGDSDTEADAPSDKKESPRDEKEPD